MAPATDAASQARLCFGTVDPNTLVAIANESSPSKTSAHVLLVNTPQLIPSLSYFAYNGLLHWLVSQPFFLARVEVYEALLSDNIPLSTINTVGHSLYALIFVVALGGLMFLVLVSFAPRRRLQSPIPLVGGCSLAIAAACHPNGKGHIPGEEIDTAAKELMWGVLVGDGEEMGSEGRGLQDSGLERKGPLYCASSAGEMISPAEWINGNEEKNVYGGRKAKVLFA